ncbi:MAG TPA: hypothetical protein VET88_06970 [Gammaproteobacteria bacterium]|nr:hypothetical protein [Gammaproteobacteria bacterium]
MIRTVSIASVFLLATHTVVHAEGWDATSLDHAVKQDSLQGFDRGMSHTEYEEATGHNRKLVLRNLKAYSRNTLESIGVPRQGVNLVSATLGMVYNNGARLNLNKSKTLALEIKEPIDSDRALFLGVRLGW